MYRETIDIALAKLDTGESTDKVTRPRLGTGGTYTGIFLWDTAFTVLWAKYHLDELPVLQSLDNLYRLQDDDGFISRQYTADGITVWPKHHPIAFAPPVLAWAELDVHALTKDTKRLAKVYPHLKKHHEYNVRTFGMDDGLFMGDPWGSGMDNLARWPHEYERDENSTILREEEVHPSVTKWIRDDVLPSPGSSWNRQARYIDMSAQMAFNALCLAKMSDLIGAQDAPAFMKEYAELGKTINTLCWNEEAQFYFDLGYGKQVSRYHIGGYWPLIAQIVPGDRLPGFLSHLTNPEKFGRLVPVPSLAFEDSDYLPTGGYWNGGSWPCTTYMILRGLRLVGQEDLAVSLARKYYDAVKILFDKTGTLWENIAPDSPEPGDWSKPDFCGWSGLGPIAIYNEFLKEPSSA